MKRQEFTRTVAEIAPRLHIAMIKQQPKDLLEGKLSFSQMVVIQLLSGRKPCKMTDIAKMLGVTKSAVTGFCDRLISMKLIKRMRSKKDRRIINIILTPKGKSMSKKLDNFRLRVISKLLSGLNQKERTQYLRILRKIAKNVMDNS